jgi:hypothetical protein
MIKRQPWLPEESKMISKTVSRGWVLLLVVVAGCAGASSTPQYQAAPAVAARPSMVIVYPLAVSASDITLNQGIFARGYRSLSGSNEYADQEKLAHDVAENVCQQVTAGLIKKGYNAICQERGVPIASDNVLIVDGEFTDISEGNRLRRTVIGFGSGASTLDTSVSVSQRTGDDAKQVLAFNTHADSGKMPGALVMGPAGAAAGGSAAVIIGANAAMGAVKGHNSSMGVFADKTSTQILDSLTNYFIQLGWTTA